jgi:transcription initiation factor TFIID subunit 5
MADANASKEKEKEKEVEVMVLNYLKKRGYRQAEASFKQEANLLHHSSLPLDQLASNASLDHDVSVANYIMFYNSNETSSPQRYIESYVKLREWIHSSLDLYKVCVCVAYVRVAMWGCDVGLRCGVAMWG